MIKNPFPLLTKFTSTSIPGTHKDSSSAGWKTVNEYKASEIAENSDDEKKILRTAPSEASNSTGSSTGHSRIRVSARKVMRQPTGYANPHVY